MTSPIPQEIPDLKKADITDVLGKLQIAQQANADLKRKHEQQLAEQKASLEQKFGKEIAVLREQNTGLFSLLQKVQPQALLDHFLALQFENACLREEIGLKPIDTTPPSATLGSHFIRRSSLVMAPGKDSAVPVVHPAEPRLGDEVKLTEPPK